MWPIALSKARDVTGPVTDGMSARFARMRQTPVETHARNEAFTSNCGRQATLKWCSNDYVLAQDTHLLDDFLSKFFTIFLFCFKAF